MPVLFRSGFQICGKGCWPSLAQRDHTQSQNHLRSFVSPTHSRKFQPLREDRLAGRFRQAASVTPLPSGMWRDAYSWYRMNRVRCWMFLQRLEHSMGPSDAFPSVFAEQRRGHRPNALGDMIVIHHALPIELLPGTWVNHAAKRLLIVAACPPDRGHSPWRPWPPRISDAGIPAA